MSHRVKRTALARRTPLRPRKPMRRQSARKRAERGPRARCVAAVRARSGGLCEGRVPGVCTGTATDVHEVVSRARGGSVTDMANCVHLCRDCHSWAHNHPAIAATLGLLKRRSEAA
jgi:5-methylcytosine-specific restriction endonuclease McrA